MEHAQTNTYQCWSENVRCPTIISSTDYARVDKHIRIQGMVYKHIQHTHTRVRACTHTTDKYYVLLRF